MLKVNPERNTRVYTQFAVYSKSHITHSQMLLTLMILKCVLKRYNIIKKGENQYINHMMHCSYFRS